MFFSASDIFLSYYLSTRHYPTTTTDDSIFLSQPKAPAAGHPNEAFIQS
jgi:hypothetical protein